MRLRLIVIPLLCILSLLASASAGAYPWPVRPFLKPHPVRANFGDPRTIYEDSLFENGIEGPGQFEFHNGIDISAPDGTPVYPVMSGTVHPIDGEAIGISTPSGREFQYYHIIPLVVDGEHVVAKRTLLGYIAKGFGHVHLSELRPTSEGMRIWNPLAPGGIAPYRDTVKPTVGEIVFREGTTLKELDPLGICGPISIVAEAYDTPQLKVPGNFANFPVAPALLTWSLREVGTGRLIQPPATAVDFRGTLPLAPDFWNVYARGTYQNAPRFGRRQFSLMPGRFLYQLTPQGFDTRILPNGVYQVTVRAEDIRGNAAGASQRFTIVNDRTSQTGCPPPHA